MKKASTANAHWQTRQHFALLLALMSQTSLCVAQETVPSAQESTAHWRFKVTPSYYQTAQETSATDVNVRANRDNHAMWIGQYDQANSFHQTRGGYEYTATTAWGQIVPSLQAASGGFVGGSLNAQWGQSTYLMTGWGRTNLKPYYNLNFDPNDALTLGVGSWLTPEHQLGLWRTQDDRLHTSQQVTHLVWRYHMPSGNRLTLDAASKSGRSEPDSEVVKGHSLTATWDWSRYFVRMARDQKVNFSDQNQKRVSLGWHY
jgi:hypothetical protein